MAIPMVVVIDDDPDVREALKLLLNPFNCRARLLGLPRIFSMPVVGKNELPRIRYPTAWIERVESSNRAGQSSEVTAKAHRAKIMKKLEAKSLAELVRMADTFGLPHIRIDLEPGEVGFLP